MGKRAFSVNENEMRYRSCSKRPRFMSIGLGIAGSALLAGSFAAPAFAGSIADQMGPYATQYAILFEGGGNSTLQVTNVVVNGNVGVGGTGKSTDSGPAAVYGRFDFSALNVGQFSNNNASNIITGGVHYGVSDVASALSAVNTLNAMLGAEAG